MATYVLVHGGGHGGWCYQRVARLLRAAGHEVYTPTLTGCGERAHLVSPDTDLETHIADVVAVLTYEDITDAILVGHSYGGMVITGVADRASARLAHLVYLDAANPKEGQSLVEVAPEAMAFARSSAQVVDGTELAMWPSPEMVAVLGVTDPDDAAWTLERLTPHPWKSMAQPLRFEHGDAASTVPQSHIVCTSTLPGRAVEELTARAEGRFWTVDTGHNLMMTEPQVVAQLLERLA